MKLIDAEKLVPKHFWQRTDKIIGYGGTQPIYEYVDVIAYDVDGAPTVEAIPIEWIKEWLENIKNDKRYKSEYVELTEDVKQVEYKGTVLIRIPCISDMLEDWEVENEDV